MTRIIMIRHGFSMANLEKRFAGHSDYPLAPLGIEQAKAAARYLAETERIDAIYASDLPRTAQTAAPLAELLQLPVRYDKELREIDAGAWDKMLYTDIKEHYADDFAVWVNDFPNSRCTGGESVAELFDRITAALARIAEAHEGQTVAIASHWTPVRAAVCHAMGLPLARIQEVPAPRNASISIFHYENGVLSLEQANIVTHLGDEPIMPKNV